MKRTANIQYPMFLFPLAWFRAGIVLCSLLFVAVPVFAAPPPPPTFSNAAGWANEAATGAGVLNEEPEPFIAKLINAALSLLGIIFLILTIYGGYVWMTARGEEQLVTKARGIITMAVIGLVVVIIAYALTRFIIAKVIGAAT